MGRGFGIASLDTPLGRLWVAATDRGMLVIERCEDPGTLLVAVERRLPGAELGEAPALLAPWLAALDDYLRGRGALPEPALDTEGSSDFDRRVWDATRAIAHGRTASYADVAVAIGRPRAARAVGGALARCPLAPVVPCHRVIHADGSIGGWGSDLDTKRWLLALESRTAPRRG